MPADGVQIVLELYFYPSPNCTKVTICLEELGLPYRLTPVDISRGEQFAPHYLVLNPNNKVPALVDHARELRLFESGAILVYLAETSGRFLGTGPAGRYEVLKWLFWQVGGLGPMAGQAHHFRAFAPEHVPYGIRRYTDEVNRLYGVLERRLRDVEWLADDYSIADMACWPWIQPHARQGQDLAQFPAVRRWFEATRARPAVRRALELGNEKLIPRERYGTLLGQTAESVRAASAPEPAAGSGRDGGR